MLKFTYIETGVHLEWITQSFKEWMALRVVLALRLGQSLSVKRCTASFLLRGDLVELHQLAEAIEQAAAGTVIPCDAEYVEVSLRGVWVTSQPEQIEGIFLVRLSAATEQLLFRLWQMSESCASSLGR